MKPKHFIITLLVLLTNISASAYEWTDANGTVWSFSTTVSFSPTGGSYEIAIIDGFSGTIPTDLTIPATVYIGETPYAVPIIGPYAFQGCSSLTSITIPESVTTIGYYAFGGCRGLTSITIPNSVTSIGDQAFYGCSGLTSIIVASDNPVYDSRNNCNAIIKTSSNKLIAGCKNTNIPNSVTSIGNSAFYNCSGLTSITIPNSVTSIESYAFEGCRGLTSITIPNSVTSIESYTFYNCSGLTSITIPNSVTSIGDHAFYGCSGLTSVVVENPMPVTISSDVFSNRANATLIVPVGSKAAYEAADYWKEFGDIVEMVSPSPTITFADANVKAICVQNWDGNGDGELSEAEAATVTDLGQVFKDNTEITSFDELQYFSGLRTISEYTFQNCKYLTSIFIPSGVVEIKNFAFMGCNALTKAEFSSLDHLCNITFSSFYSNPMKLAKHLYINGTEVKDLVIPNNVTAIGNNTFEGCTGLLSVSFHENVTTIEDYAFSGCTGISSITIPSHVTSIGGSSFVSCTGITAIAVAEDNSTYDSRGVCNGIIEKATNTLIIGCKNTIIPNSVTAIGSNAFACCSGLSSIIIPNSVTTIGSYAFQLCSGLTSISIPQSMSFIGNYAFSGCNNITSVRVNNPIPLTISSMDFPNRANATLYVPAGCKPAYETAAYWGEFREIIAPIGDLSELSNTKLYTLSDAGGALRVMGNTLFSFNGILDPDYMGLVSNVSQLSSPSTDAEEGSLAALLDNNAGTFWHSNWHDGSVPAHSHYLQVELTESVSENIYLQVTRRQAENDHITQWGVYGSNNATAADGDWEELATIDMPYGNKSETLLSAPFDTKGYKYLRFYIDNTTGSGGSTRGYGHLSEFRLFTANDLADYPGPANDTYCQFALLNINDKYYLYSPAARAFWMAQGGFCPGFGSAITLSADGASGDYRWTLSMPLDGQTVSLYDAPLKIMPVAEFDPSEALAAFAENVDLGLADGYYRIRSAGQYTNTVTDEAGQESEVRVYKYMRNSVDGSGNYYGSWSTPADLTSDLASLWKLTNRDGLFDLQNMYSQGRFTTVSGDARAMMSETSESLMAFDRVTEVNGQKILNIRVASQNIADHYYLHMRGHSGGSGVSGDIVGWLNTGSSGASEWVLEPVSEEEAAILTSIAIGDTFTAPVPCGDGTVDLTFKVTNLSPWEVEVSASPEDIAGALTIPATVQHESGIEFAVTGVGCEAFIGRHNLTAVSLPQGVIVIKDRAFDGCENLVSVMLPSTLRNIYSGAFWNCVALSSITLPDGLTKISLATFQNTPSLKSINLPEGIITIEHDAFRGSGLESIKFPSTLTEVGENAFRDSKLNDIDFNGCSSTFGFAAFAGCNSLEQVYIPNTVSINGIQVFNWCHALKKVEFQEGYKCPGSQTFWHCINLEEVILPTNEVFSYTGWFLECPNIKTVTFLDAVEGGDLPMWDFNQQFDLADPKSCRFIIPEGKAELFLCKGYMNISDLSGLPLVREDFEAEAERISTMAGALSDGDKASLNAALDEARAVVNAAEDYLTIFEQIDAIKSSAKLYLTTATIPQGFDVTAANVINPNIDRYAIGWKLPMSIIRVGFQAQAYSNENSQIDRFVFTWSNSSLGNGQITQTISALPAGNYRLEADIIATNQDDASAEVTGVSLVAGGERTAVATENGKPQHFSVSFENKMTKDVKIGIDISSTNANWVAMDNVRLYFESAAADLLLPSHTELASSETDTLYLYNVEDEAFLKAGNSHSTHAVLGNEGLPVRLTQDSETGLWQVYFWEGSGSDKLLFREYGYTDEAYVDFNSTRGDADPNLAKWLLTESVNGTFLIQNKTLEGTEKFLGNVPSRLDCQNNYSGETHTDVIATAPSTENVHWLLMTKKQYDKYQSGLIYQNMLYADEALSVVPEGLVTLKLNLKNEASVNMTDFYLQLPEGITIVDNASGKPDVTLNSSRSNGHVVTSQRNADGIYHIVCYSSKNGAFKSNDGLLFNIKLQCAAGTAAGNYTAVLKNILMSDVNKKEITQPDYTISIEVPDLTLGDVNDDSRINGVDIVEMVDRIMQRPSDTFHFLAADLNFDSKINALDLVKLIALVLNQGVTPTTGNHAPAAGRTLQTEAEGLSLEAAADGALTMGVAAADRFILTQCVVELEEGMQLEGVTTDASHTAVWQQLDDQRYAVLAYSTGNAAFAKNEALLSFVVKGQGHVSVTDALVVNEQREPMYLARADKDVATGIGNVNGDENVNVYDLGGRKYDDGKLHGGKLTKGVFIVNGKKVVVK